MTNDVWTLNRTLTAALAEANKAAELRQRIPAALQVVKEYRQKLLDRDVRTLVNLLSENELLANFCFVSH